MKTRIAMKRVMMSLAWRAMKKIQDLKMKSLMTLFAQKVSELLLSCSLCLFSFMGNTVNLN